VFSTSTAQTVMEQVVDEYQLSDDRLVLVKKVEDMYSVIVQQKNCIVKRIVFTPNR